jgi:hypothetical protein
MSNNGTMDLMFGGKGISFAGADGFEDLKKEAAVEAHNKAVDAYTKALNENIKDELAKAEEVTEKMNSMEIMPINSYILVNGANLLVTAIPILLAVLASLLNIQ